MGYNRSMVQKWRRGAVLEEGSIGLVVNTHRGLFLLAKYCKTEKRITYTRHPLLTGTDTGYTGVYREYMVLVVTGQ